MGWLLALSVFASGAPAPNVRGQVTSQILLWVSQNSKIFQWTALESKPEGTLAQFAIAPSCVNAGGLEEFRDHSPLSFHAYVQTAKVSYNIPTWTIFPFREIGERGESRLSYMTFVIDPDQFSQTGTMLVNGKMLSKCGASK